MEKEMKRKQRLFFAIAFLVIEAFYLFFALYDGVDICDDSLGYMSMDVAREPFYPLFLALVRRIIGNSDFNLSVVVILQSLLAGAAALIPGVYLTKKFTLKSWQSVMIFLFPLFVSLLCRFGAARAAMYSNSILTEGITISLFLIFFRFLLEYLFEASRKGLICSILLSTILIMTRKQMMITLFLLILAVIWVGLVTRKVKRLVFDLLLSVLIIMGVSTLGDYYYNYSLRGIWEKHSSDTRFLTTVGYYIADEADIETIEDEKIRELTSDIFTIVTEEGHTRVSATGNWSDRVDHFMNHYDLIQISTMWPMVRKYVEEEEHIGGEAASYRTDEILRMMNSALLYTNLDKAFLVFIDNFRYGLVTTVAQKHPLLNWYTLIAYIGFFVLWCISVRKYLKRTRSSEIVFSLESKEYQRMTLGLFTMISILFNVGLVAAVIFCQPRYTIYNMPLFYMAGIVLLDVFRGND